MIECIASKGETDVLDEPVVALGENVPGRLMICICDGIGIAGSMGPGRLRIATNATVEGEKEISEARV